MHIYLLGSESNAFYYIDKSVLVENRGLETSYKTTSGTLVMSLISLTSEDIGTLMMPSISGLL